MFPRAEVVVHERGARHLVDPERLMASARRVFGTVLDDVFGLLEPTDASRVRALGDTGPIDLGGGRRLEAFHAPGHAQHHVGLVDSRTGDLYVGDAAGMYIPETGGPAPVDTTAGLRPRPGARSLQRFRDVAPNRLLFSHFGPVVDVDDDPGACGGGAAAVGRAGPRRPAPTGWTSTTPSQRVTEKTASATPPTSPTRTSRDKFEHLNADRGQRRRHHPLAGPGRRPAAAMADPSGLR